MRKKGRPVLTGAVGLAILAGLVLVAFNIDNLPLIGGGTGYAAAFRDASGLAPGNEVRVAGVKVGKVTGIGLAHDGSQPYVRVVFRVSGVRLGSATVATIRIKTVLGQKYLALAPAGDTPLPDGAQIPLEHTASPLDVVDAVNGLADTLQQIDTKQLAQAFTVLSQAFADTPADVRTSLSGLSRLTQSVAERDDQLRSLLAQARAVTGVLAKNDEALRELVTNGNLLLNEVIARRDAIHDLLVTSTQLATQISGLVADNRARLGPALAHLRDVLAILQRNRNNLDQTVAKMAPFIDAFTNVLGNGRWFDSFLAGLLQPYQPTVGGR
jgi:phospholipid/cholesterol/gamma-HCH transport system substrate-binding protein